MIARSALVLVWSAVSIAGGRIDQQTTPARPLSASQTGTASIGGLVTTADGTDQPIRRAIVRLSAPELRGSREIATDDRGRFLFVDLPAGRYGLSASKPGFVNAVFGQKRPRGPGLPIALTDGQKEASLRIALPRGAVVSGRVTDEFGLPIARARMAISEKTTINGETTLTSAFANNAMTDDRGMYRLYGLSAGTYVLSVSDVSIAREGVRPTTPADVQWAVRQGAASNASGQYSQAPPAAQSVAYSQIFHPSAVRAADAAPIELEAGAERAGIDITVRFVPVAGVSGTVTMLDAAPVSGASVVLVADDPGGDSGMRSMLNSRTNGQGEFTFSSAKSGRYKVMVQASSRASGGRGGGPPELWGMTDVNVEGRDVTGVTVVLQPGMTVAGRIVIDPAATTQTPDLTSTRISLGPAQRSGTSFGVAPATIGADGSFTMTGAAPGSYRMTVSPPLAPNTMGAPYVWVTKSVTIQGRGVLERPFDIRPGENIDGVVVTLTDRITSLSGKLVDSQGKPASDYFVIVLPADRAFWLQGLFGSPRSARPANDGSFRFNALPPAEYYLGATTDFESRDLYRAEFLEQFIPTAIKLTIAEGEKKVQDLRIDARATPGVIFRFEVRPEK